ncbi:MAG: aspartyl/asparaginyl beta-hydroxylase domain-containing protein [Bdellovibrionaceae bacterium]|nr:aspartyl/asparaginyl beta-hydroxylase domain-containing protein [Pseudobdellovibrionaceae bacterium]
MNEPGENIFLIGDEKVRLTDFQNLQIKKFAPNPSGFDITYLSRWPYLETKTILNVPPQAIEYFDRNRNIFKPDNLPMNEGWSYFSLFGSFDSLFASSEELVFKRKNLNLTFSPMVKDIWPDFPEFIRKLPFEVATATVIALQPHSRVCVHIDKKNFGLDKLLIPLNAPQDAHFVFYQYGAIPFKEGHVYAIDASHLHYAVNQSSSVRYNLIVRGYLDETLPAYLNWIKEGFNQNGEPRFLKIPSDLKWQPANLITTS